MYHGNTTHNKCYPEEKMNMRNKKINNKLRKLGKTLGLDEVDTLQAKRNAKNIIAAAIVSGILLVLGNMMMQTGPVGLYYAGTGVKDFQLSFRTFL